jgi:hypothetical protein
MQLKKEFIFRNRHLEAEVIDLGHYPAGHSWGLTENYLHLTLAQEHQAAPGCFPLPLSEARVLAIQLQPAS